jgi:hypothetical protein
MVWIVKIVWYLRFKLQGFSRPRCPMLKTAWAPFTSELSALSFIFCRKPKIEELFKDRRSAQRVKRSFPQKSAGFHIQFYKWKCSTSAALIYSFHPLTFCSSHLLTFFSPASVLYTQSSNLSPQSLSSGHHPISLQLLMQCFAGDAEAASRLTFVPPGGFKGI